MQNLHHRPWHNLSSRFASLFLSLYSCFSHAVIIMDQRSRKHQPRDADDTSRDNDAAAAAAGAATAAPASPQVYKLKIELPVPRGAQAIWRTVTVPSNMRLARLHDVVQAVMGWGDCHLHQFEDMQGRTYMKDPFDSGGDVPLEEKKVQIGSVLRAVGEAMQYLYDFGDNWEHIISLLEISPPRDAAALTPAILDGAGAAPVEDSGGLCAYLDMLENRDEDPERAEWFKEMTGRKLRTFDAAKFDKAAATARLRAEFP